MWNLSSGHYLFTWARMWVSVVVFRCPKGRRSKNVWKTQPRQYGLPAIVAAFIVTGSSMIKIFYQGILLLQNIKRFYGSIISVICGSIISVIYGSIISVICGSIISVICGSIISVIYGSIISVIYGSIISVIYGSIISVISLKSTR